MSRGLAAIVAVTVSLAGCGGSSTPASPTTPTPLVSPAGTWSGSAHDAISGDGALELSLADQSNQLTGTWSATFKNGDRFSGRAIAPQIQPSGYAILLYADPQPSCSGTSGSADTSLLNLTLVNVVVTSSQLTAASGRLSCSGFSSGSVSLSKQ